MNIATPQPIDWRDEYDRAPNLPTSPLIVPFSQDQALAVMKALKATGMMPGMITASAAAGIVISELHALGWVVRRDDQ